MSYQLELDKIEVDKLLKILTENPEHVIVFKMYPTGIGTRIDVEVNGKSIDITNYDSW